METLLDTIHSLLIPVGGDPLLLPNAAVAEISAYKEAQPINEAPDWLAGLFEWRGITIPLIQFERMCDEQEIPGSYERVAIFNSLGGNKRLPFFAIATKGIPRLIKVNGSILTATPGDAAEQGPVRKSVMLNGEPARIPDLDVMEKTLLDVKPLMAALN